MGVKVVVSKTAIKFVYNLNNSVIESVVTSLNLLDDLVLI